MLYALCMLRSYAYVIPDPHNYKHIDFFPPENYSDLFLIVFYSLYQTKSINRTVTNVNFFFFLKRRHCSFVEILEYILKYIYIYIRYQIKKQM